MPTEQMLIQEVLASPDADAPRIALRELYEAEGDSRGELLRVQMQYSEMRRQQRGVAFWGPLHKRARELVESGWALWKGRALSELLEADLASKPVFHRGFVEELTFDAEVFAKRAEEFYAAAPIRHITLTNVMAYPLALASKHLARIASLQMTGQEIDDATIEILASSPFATRLRWLEIDLNEITRAGLDALAGSVSLRGLRYLGMRGNRVEDPTDRYEQDGEAIYESEMTELGLELERKFGRLPWLHSPGYFPIGYPPSFEATADA